MEIGHVLEYMEERSFRVALCLLDRGSRIQALNEAGREVNMGIARILHVDHRRLNTKAPRHRIQEQLKTISEKRKSLAGFIDIREIWELVTGEDSSFEPVYLADILFGENTSPDHEAAFIRAVIQDKVHFKFKDHRVFPQSPDKVSRLLEQQEIERRREEELGRESEWLTDVLEHGLTRESALAHRETVEALKQTAMGDPNFPLFRKGEEILRRSGLGGWEQAFDVLVRLDVWSPDHNLDIERYQIPMVFPPEAEEHVHDLVTRGSLPAHDREDLRDMAPMTIDSASTSDYDDALSVSFTGNGYRLGIHITEVAGYILPETVLDRCARERGTTIYLPDERVSMLPTEISDRLCSLRVGEEKRALSLLVDLDATLEITGYSFVPSLIRVARRLSYSEVDLLWDRDEELKVMARFSQKLLQKRLDSGGLPQPPFEMALYVEPDGNVVLKRIERDSVSRILVSESMILANRLAAEFLGNRNVPALFRGQSEPKERIEGDLCNDLLCIFRQRRQLQPLLMDTRPVPHSCLGVEYYTNMTSPLRRYMDLVVQRQILAELSQTPPLYSHEALKQMLQEVEPAVKRANLVKNRRYRYWMLKYFKKLQGQKFQALVLERHMRNYRVLLTDTLFEANLPLVPAMELKPGEYVSIRIDRANPRDDLFKISLS